MAKYTLLTKEIREAIEKMYDSGVYTFGVRAMTRKPSGERVMVRPGDDVENSYAAYDDVEPRELGGASSVGFSVDFGKVEDEDHFNEIIERVAREYAEDEDQIAIIAGRHNLDDENNDMGETLISSPTVVSVVGDARGILAKKPIGSASESGSALPSLLLGGTYAERMARALAGGWDTDVFHGTADDIQAFALSERGKNTQAKSAQGAFWFVDNPEVAGGYARMAAEDAPVQRLIEASQAAERRRDFDAADALTLQAEKLELSGELVGGGGQNIMPLKIKGGNLMQIDADGATMSDLDDSQLHKWVTEAKNKGYDGLKISNFSDNADYGNYTPATHYAIFDPKNIRSVNADFNPANASSSDLLAGIQSAAPIGAGALLAGAALAPEDAEAGVITKGGKRLIEAWHGSPHTFDKFDISKIGTGEGAQSYGHGLYFADNPIVSEDYKRRLQILSEAEQRIYKETIDALKSGAELTPESRNLVEAAQSDFQFFEKRNAASDEIINYLSDGLNAGRGALYRAHIDVDPDTLLDWDRPLSEQSEYVRKAYAKAEAAGDPILLELLDGSQESLQLSGLFSKSSGAQAYNTLADGSPETATQRLREAGIPGIRYRDQMSRGDTAEPTFNYVMFDDKPISIVERGNASPEALAATAVATATAAALNNFQARRAAKRDYWRQMRQEITDFASAVAGGAFAALDKPLQGYMGLAGVAGTLAAGGSLPQALQHGAQIARQPSDVTAYQYGQTVNDALAPYSRQGAAIAGALTNAGIQLTSPF
jgi:hypothetical protein